MRCKRLAFGIRSPLPRASGADRLQNGLLISAATIVVIIGDGFIGLARGMAHRRRRRGQSRCQQIGNRIHERDRRRHDPLRKSLAEALQEILSCVDRKIVGRPGTRPGHGRRYCRERLRDRVDVFFGGAKRNDREIDMLRDFDIEIEPVAAAVDDKPSVQRVTATIEDQGQLLGQPPVQNRKASPPPVPSAWDRSTHRPPDYREDRRRDRPNATRPFWWCRPCSQGSRPIS